MANSFIHAKSSVRRFGGVVEDYQPIHDWFDATKAAYADQRHRAILHNTFGIFLCEQRFGHAITNAAGQQIPVRLIAEQHVVEDCGFIPTLENWLDQLPRKEWMIRGAKPLSKILANLEATEREAEAAIDATVDASLRDAHEQVATVFRLNTSSDPELA